MGAYLSEPMTSKESEDGDGNKLKFGACSMQGWRVTQEDAHNCIPKFDDSSSLFGVYDGHGGSEVAIYISRHFPDLLKKTEAYKNGNINEALIQAFLQMDASIKEPEVLAELQRIAKAESGETEGESAVDYEEENVGQLYEEATMPLEKLVAKYSYQGQVPEGESTNDSSVAESEKPCSSGSSKILFKSSGLHMIKDKEDTSGQSDKTENVKDEPAAGSSSKAEPEEASSTTSEVLDTSSSNNDSQTSNKPVDCDSTTRSTEILAITKEIGGNSETSEIISSCQKEEPNDSLSSTKNISAATVNGNGEGISNECSPKEQLSNPLSNGDNDPQASCVKKEDAEEKPKPRKGKVHPVPVVVQTADKSRRVSPRKSGRNLTNMAFADSDSDLSSDSDDAANPQRYAMDSDSSLDDEEEVDNNSTTSEEQDGEEDEDDSDEDEDDTFLSEFQEPGFDSGTTAVVAFLRWESDKLKLWVANAGDSRCVVSRSGEALEMSYDHKPESEVEALRIVNAGGKVTEDGRVNGGLNLSRAIGDHSYKQNPTLPPEEQMISPLPTIQHIELDPEKDDFVVLACDGVWNSMSSQQVVEFVAERIKTATSLSKICEELFDDCLSPDTSGDGTGCDNMTALIVQLPKSSSGIKRSIEEPEADGEPSKKLKIDTE